MGMNGRLYRVTRDLHLYLGLFISPFVLVFAVSVFFLVHAWLPGAGGAASGRRTVTALPLPANLEELSGRPLVDALKPVMTYAQVAGEIGFVQRNPREHRLIVPVSVPGRVTTVTIDTQTREASVERRTTGLADALVVLHKAPGPHLVSIRMNWWYMRVWQWLADATVYVVLFLSVSGVYLWFALRAERLIGLLLLGAGAATFFGTVYALCH
jgi:hypothetical protein